MADWPVSQVMARFGLRAVAYLPVRCKPTRAVLQVHTDQGTFCLKVLDVNPDRVGFIHRAAAHLHQQGLPVATLLPTPRGEPCVRLGGRVYVLMPWIPGQRPRYEEGDNLERLAALLAQVHAAGAGFAPQGVAPVDRVDRWLDRCQEYLDLLPRLRQRALRRGGATSERFLAHYHRLEARLAWALDRARQGPGAALVARFRQSPVLGHRDFCRVNTLLAPDGTLWVVDLDTLAYTLPAADLLRLLRDVFHDLGWSRELLDRTLAAYSAVRPLAEDERAFLLEQLAVPRLAVDLFKRHLETAGGEPYLEELEKALANGDALVRDLGLPVE